MNVDLAILLEMVSLWAGTILLFIRKNPTVEAGNVIVNIAIPSGIPILALMAILTAIADITHEEWPAYAGLLIAGSALIAEGTIAADAVNQLIMQYSTFAMGEVAKAKGTTTDLGQGPGTGR